MDLGSKKGEMGIEQKLVKEPIMTTCHLLMIK